VGNDPGTEVLEMTLTGPELLFTAPAVFAVSGAPVAINIDGHEKPIWSRLAIQAGQKLKLGKVANGGLRFYLAVKGGFPEMYVNISRDLTITPNFLLVQCTLDQKLALQVSDLVVHRYLLMISYAFVFSF
jgi:hypothetical protein